MSGLRGEKFEYEGASEEELNRRFREWPNRTQAYEIEASIEPGQASRLELNLLQGERDKTVIGFDGRAGQLYDDRSQSGETQFSAYFPTRTVAPLRVKAGQWLTLHIFVDKLSVEVFAQDGVVSMTNLVFPNAR